MTNPKDTADKATAADVRMLWEAIDSLRARVAVLECGHVPPNLKAYRITPYGVKLVEREPGAGDA